MTNPELETLCKEILEVEKDKVTLYKNGKKGMLGFFVGCVMKETKMQADLTATREILKKLLNE